MILTKQMINAPAVDNKDKWRTPPVIYQPLNHRWQFNLDPCCEKKEESLCENYFTPVEDGLSKNWEGFTVFCNPPYSRGNIDMWVEKCYAESLKRDTYVIGLLPVSSSAKWWHKYLIRKAGLYFVERRIQFVGAPYKAPFSSVIAVWGINEVGSFSQANHPVHPIKENNFLNK